MISRSRTVAAARFSEIVSGIQSAKTSVSFSDRESFPSCHKKPMAMEVRLLEKENTLCSMSVR